MNTGVAKSKTIQLTFEGQPPPTASFDVFAFGANGKLIARTTAKGGAVDLANIDASSHLFVMPSGVIGAGEAPSMETLRSKKAYEPVLTAKPDGLTILPVPRDAWGRWATGQFTCHVLGRVVAAPQNLPLPFVRVHVVEIDVVRMIDQIAKTDLFRLRDELLRVNPNPPDPPYRIPGPAMADRMPAMAQPAVPMMARTGAPVTPPLAPATVAALRTDSEALVRSTLEANARDFLPWMIGVDWIWNWNYYDYYFQEELAFIETKIDGRFDANVSGCTTANPNLYFWVEAPVDDVWTTVYRPSIGWQTYWGYQSDHEVTITVADRRAVPVRLTPVITKGVEILRLGRQYIPSIDQTTGLLLNGAPFGGTICPVISFADLTGVASHYRWQYRRLTNADKTPATDTWHDLTAEVFHHYRERRVIPRTEVIDRIKPYRLGPIGPDHLYEIPPIDAKSLSLHTPGFDAWWVMYANPGDEVSGYFNSNAGGTDASPIAGKFELRLQLFTGVAADGTGGTVVRANDPFSIPQLGGSDDTVNAVRPPDAMLEMDASKTVVFGFTMVLFVDNAKCTAAIKPAQVGTAVADACGMLHSVAGGTAKISFVASHPRNYATVSFSLKRGRDLPDIANGNVADPCLPPTDPTGYVLIDTTFTRKQPVKDLLGPCGNGAAYAEELNVAAKATDGYSRLSYLDAHALEPFAIIP